MRTRHAAREPCPVLRDDPDGKEVYSRGDVCVCVCVLLTHSAGQEKVTQRCKAPGVQEFFFFFLNPEY